MNYYCMYCSQRCSKAFPESVYWDCKKCKVRFMEGTSGCDIIEFTRRLKAGDISYRLELYVQLNTTILVSIKTYPDVMFGQLGDEVTLINVKGILNGVNPENVENKIKNLLLFL